jgi:hypothetical protein
MMNGGSVMSLKKEEKDAIAARIAPYLKSSIDPDTWRKVFVAALDNGVTFEEAVAAADAWVANKTAEFKALNQDPPCRSNDAESS